MLLNILTRFFRTQNVVKTTYNHIGPTGSKECQYNCVLVILFFCSHYLELICTLRQARALVSMSLVISLATMKNK